MKLLAWDIALIGIFVSAAAFSQTHSADLKVVIRHTFENDSPDHESPPFAITEYYSGQNSRTEMQFASGKVLGHHRAVIRRREADKIQVYDLDFGFA